MDIFEYSKSQNLKKESPLALRMRPQHLYEVVGQEHILGKGKPLYNLIVADKLSSIILYGPPGTGKTTIAYVIAQTTKKEFEIINATTAGINDIKKVIDKAYNIFSQYSKKTILFIDEIHRFNKLQQDALLPAVEEGYIVLIGATTENPFFEVNKALISRSLIFELFLLNENDIRKIIKRALNDKEKGLGFLNIEISNEAEDYIVKLSNGDARVALNILEAVVFSKQVNNNKILIELQDIQECFGKKYLYDNTGDMHYDVISAFIKSMRGSDPDATLYYLALMLESGEDIRFIARRILICAAEDVGLANPMALVVASSAAYACEYVGLPEARLILSEAALYIACSPKSNSSYLAIKKATEDVKNTTIKCIPSHLKMTSVGPKQQYLYPHDYPLHYVKQQYLPNELIGRTYYHPTDLGDEKHLKEYIEYIRNMFGKE